MSRFQAALRALSLSAPHRAARPPFEYDVCLEFPVDCIQQEKTSCSVVNALLFLLLPPPALAFLPFLLREQIDI